MRLRARIAGALVAAMALVACTPRGGPPPSAVPERAQTAASPPVSPAADGGTQAESAARAPTYPDGSWSVHDLLLRTDLTPHEVVRITAQVLFMSRCPPCPRERRCSPCPPTYYVIGDPPRAGDRVRATAPPSATEAPRATGPGSVAADPQGNIVIHTVDDQGAELPPPGKSGVVEYRFEEGWLVLVSRPAAGSEDF